MFSIAKSIYRLCNHRILIRYYNKVTLLGANGAVGQNLSLMLKYSKLIQELCVYDISNSKGLAKDLSHINTKALVTSYQSQTELKPCLEESDIVVIMAGVTRRPGMHRSEVFDENAKIVASLVSHVGKYCPESMLCILTNPLNSLVPMAAEILKKMSVYDPRKLFGVTTIDVVRANTFVAQSKGLNHHTVQVPVIGGHSGITIVPLLSQTVPRISFKVEDRGELTSKIQRAGRLVVEEKQGMGTASLSQAYACSNFLDSLISALDGKVGVIQCSYVQSKETEASFFASPLLLGKHGVEEFLGIGSLNEYEVKLLKRAIPELIKDIELGESYGKRYVDEHL